MSLIFPSNVLLADWRWLCPEPLTLLARNAFGDWFLKSESDRVFMLPVSVGEFEEIAESEEQFRSLASTEEKRQKWFAQDDEATAAQRCCCQIRSNASASRFR
jgi:hypothetical protein